MYYLTNVYPNYLCLDTWKSNWLVILNWKCYLWDFDATWNFICPEQIVRSIWFFIFKSLKNVRMVKVVIRKVGSLLLRVQNISSVWTKKWIKSVFSTKLNRLRSCRHFMVFYFIWALRVLARVSNSGRHSLSIQLIHQAFICWIIQIRIRTMDIVREPDIKFGMADTETFM